jgi:hypothetical protein
MKMRHRHAHEYTERDHNVGWDAFLARQLRKFGNKIDLVNEWARREFFILEKMNGGVFAQESRLKYGGAWTFAANMQVTKLDRVHRIERRKGAQRDSYQAVMLAFRNRQCTGQKDGPWRMTQLAAVLQAAYLSGADDWRQVIWNACRRNNRLLPP